MFQADRDPENETCNVLVMTDSGKPVFARYGTDEEITRICGLLQALGSSIKYSGSSGYALGDIQSLQAGSMQLVFMNVHAITLVAIDTKRQNQYTEQYLRLQLEYVYSQILFALTSQVQSVLQQNASLDLRSWLGSTSENVICSWLDDTVDKLDAPFLFQCTPIFYPLASVYRNKASRVLQSVGKSTENTVFAFMCVESSILTLLQPSYSAHYMRNSDLQLLLHFIHRQQSNLYTSDLWLPVCLPRFCETGYLYCYTHCLDVDCKLMLVLLSTNGNTEQFGLFRQASSAVREQLGIPAIVDAKSINGSSNDDTPIPTRVIDDEKEQSTISLSASEDNEAQVVANITSNSNSDDDYVDLAVGDGATVPFMPSDDAGSFLSEVVDVINSNRRDKLLQDYLDMSGVSHFTFRLDVPLHTQAEKSSLGGVWSQVVSSNTDRIASNEIQSTLSQYQDLSLKLKSGKRPVHSGISNVFNDDITQDGNVSAASQSHYSSTELIESCTHAETLVCVCDDKTVYLGMNGRNFELYMVMHKVSNIRTVSAASSKLAKKLLSDQNILFVTTPLLL